MLENHLDIVKKHSIEYITVDNDLRVISVSNTDFNLQNGALLLDWHLFFNTLVGLDPNADNTYSFSCIHFEINKIAYIVDIYYYTFKQKNNLIVIQNLTSHYTNYQTTAQIKNESVIKSERLKTQNLLLKKQEEFKLKFINNFNHELREPLSSVISFCEFLKDTKLDYQQENYLNVIETSSNHLKKIIDDILLISVLKTKGLKLNKDLFNFNEFITNLSQIYKVRAEDKGLIFNFKINGKTQDFIFSDKVKLRQVLANLLSNAIKYTNSGTISFIVSLNQFRARKQNITFQIVDTGIGISEDRIEGLFVSFSEILTSKADMNMSTRSLGLGLPITKSLVDLFDGKIEVKSEINSGTEFMVNLNLEINEVTQETEHDTKRLKKKLQEKGKIKILLVDNSETLQITFLKIFSKIKNIDLDILTDPSTLIDTIEITDYNLILMGINLQKHNGLELTKAIRRHRHKVLKQTPILAITGNVFDADLKLYKKAGISDTLKKPFSKGELYNILDLNL